ncbi:MAG: ferrochelatase [Candidatus Rhabdochlamydia sp.]
MSNTYLIINFGGPRDLEEVEDFLKELLTDREVIRTPFPSFIHRLLFTRIAKKRALKVIPEYAKIGGKSPIYEDTEKMAATLRQYIQAPILTFHRYLPKTHASFLSAIEQIPEDHQIRVFPMFPQFSYATTGSVAHFFSRHLCGRILNQLSWIKSYAAHPLYLGAFEQQIRLCLEQHQLKEEEVCLLFSAHAIPRKFICTGDPYEKECHLSFLALKKRFPQAVCHLSYQSQFDKQEWLRPYTSDVCEEITNWTQDRKIVIVVPLSFTSDHIETLFEIESLYLPVIRKQGVAAIRCPALNHHPDWVQAILAIMKQEETLTNQMLVRHPIRACCSVCAPSCCMCKTIQRAT